MGRPAVDNGCVRPRFSVVLPVRDRAESVARATVSVLAQTFGNLELVVIDEGSTDGTLDAVRMVADERVVLLDATRHSSMLRTAVSRCRGEMIAITDADTVPRPQWLARIGMLISRTSAEVVFCGGSEHHLHGTTSEIRPTRCSTRPGAFVVPTTDLRVALEQADADSDDRTTVERWLSAEQRTVDHHCESTPETLVDWYDAAHQVLPEGDELRLLWSLDAIDALGESPIPDVGLLARYATVGGLAAARLRHHRQARSLLGLARSVSPGELKPFARWAVSTLPPLADRVWEPHRN